MIMSLRAIGKQLSSIVEDCFAPFRLRCAPLKRERARNDMNLFTPFLIHNVNGLHPGHSVHSAKIGAHI